jgi:hypothetical protein
VALERSSQQAEGMSGWPEALFERCCAQADGVAVGEGAFAPGPALWLGTREVAHVHGGCTLEVRLTKAEIRRRRDELAADGRVTLRASASDWVELTVESADDREWAANVVLAAIEANRATAPAGLPPTGAALARRRRFH